MAVLASDCQRYFRLLQNYCMWSRHIYQICFSLVPQEVLFFRVIQNPTWQPLSLIDRDLFLPQNYIIWSHQTCRKFSSRGSEEVLLVFAVIRNPRWMPLLLIGWNIFYFFSRKTACYNTRHSRNIFQNIECLFPMEKTLFRLYPHLR